MNREPKVNSGFAMLLRKVWLLLLLLLATSSHALDPPQLAQEPPRIRALLEQAWSAESGRGYSLDPHLSLLLYCQAGLSGSPEGYFRIGLLFMDGPQHMRDEAQGRGYLALAAQLGHERAAAMLDETPAEAPELDDCAGFEAALQGARFDLEDYLSKLPKHKQAVAEIIRQDARKYAVSESLAIAVACAESNLDAHAVSPKNAQGVMQLIPDTQQRFGVSKPFDVHQNVRGGLRYLKWLLARFDGNVSFAVAAYNAGEGTVQRFGGVPPFAETRAYVKRVLYFAGLPGFVP